MKSKHRKSRRRYIGRRRNDRHRSIITILFILLFTAAVIIGTVALGKDLKKKAELSALERETLPSETSKNEPDTENESVLSGISLPISFKGELLRIEDIEKFLTKDDFAKEVSIVFRETSGKIVYSSPSAVFLGIQSADNKLSDASDIISKLHEKGCYVSAYISLSSHKNESSALVGAVHALESALITEITKAGADEIILCGIEKIDKEIIEGLKSLSTLARKENGNSVPLGILLPYSLFEGTEANNVCAEFSKYFEILLVDLSTITAEEGQSKEEMFDKCIEALQMYFSRYSLRPALDTNSTIREYEDTSLDETAVYSRQRIDRDLLYNS